MDTDPFEEIVSELVKEAAGLVGQPVPTDMDSRFRMIYHVGAGYAIPNAEDTPTSRNWPGRRGSCWTPFTPARLGPNS